MCYMIKQHMKIVETCIENVKEDKITKGKETIMNGIQTFRYWDCTLKKWITQKMVIFNLITHELFLLFVRHFDNIQVLFKEPIKNTTSMSLESSNSIFLLFQIISKPFENTFTYLM